MPEILGKAKTVRELLKGVKYSIDYYQREYKWQEKQISELLTDLTEKFFEKFDPNHERKEVRSYPHYFLGSIIVSRKESGSYIVDGQQRLTSLTLLLLYLRHLQQGKPQQVNVDELIFSERFGEKSFNLDVPERTPCMEALFMGESLDPAEQPESVQNLIRRYQDIEKSFPEEIRNGALPFFTDWLLENVHLVEITAESDEDAYTIFETMNDRGLSLSPTDMLKGYLLASISDVPKRTTSNFLWKKRITELAAAEKDADADCFKAWFRSQYANSIRERKRGATPQDFDRIGTEFHRWLREHAEKIGLRKSDDFFNFIYRDFEFFSRQYLLLIKASFELVPGLEQVLYNLDHGFTLQYLLLLAPLQTSDSQEVVHEKLSLVARFIDILLAWRIWNGRSITYSTMSYATYLVMLEIRGLDAGSLAERLQKTLAREQETFAGDEPLRLNQQNRRAVHRILARITDFVEVGCKNSSRYRDFVTDTGKNRYEIEHIWANKWERYRDEFNDRAEFGEFRNRIGGLLLLPKSFNASYGDLTYIKKLPHYNTQKEMLARSLSPDCYGKHNPSFQNFIRGSGLSFEACEEFHRAELDSRSELYREIARQVWNPTNLVAKAN